MAKITITTESPDSTFGDTLDECPVPPHPAVRVLTDFSGALQTRGYDVRWQVDKYGRRLELVYQGVAGAYLVSVDVPTKDQVTMHTLEHGLVEVGSPEALRAQLLALIRDRSWRQRLDACYFLAQSDP